MRRHKYQFVWWWTSWGLGYVGPYPIDGVNKGWVYLWRFILGPLEIRRWNQSGTPTAPVRLREVRHEAETVVHR